MKKISTLVFVFIISVFIEKGIAQISWCAPSVVPYGPTTPGITEVKLNTIDRVSQDLESSNSNYELTDQSTTLIRGQSYTISITHTIDASICPDMNLRVWIDLNLNGDLDDNGETLVSVDHHAAGTYTATFTIPTTSSLGETRMRVTAKMSNLGGHTLPTPCNVPPDPIGYHGEVEDYSVVIGANTGIFNASVDEQFLNVFPNPSTSSFQLSYSLKSNQHVRGELYNAIGQRLNILFDEEQPSGEENISVNTENLVSGIYLVKLLVGDKVYSEQLAVMGK